MRRPGRSISLFMRRRGGLIEGIVVVIRVGLPKIMKARRIFLYREGSVKKWIN